MIYTPLLVVEFVTELVTLIYFETQVDIEVVLTESVVADLDFSALVVFVVTMAGMLS